MPIVVGIGLAVFQQVTGINTVIHFAPTIFQASGLSSASAAILATAGIGVVNVLMTTVAIRLVDRVGPGLPHGRQPDDPPSAASPSGLARCSGC